MKKPNRIPKITILRVAFKPSNRLSFVKSTNSLKSLRSTISNPTASSSPLSSVYNMVPLSPTIIPLNAVFIAISFIVKLLSIGNNCGITIFPPSLLKAIYPFSPESNILVVLSTSNDVKLRFKLVLIFSDSISFKFQ